MIAYIQGKLVDLSPTMAVIECTGIAYAINISLTTFSNIQDQAKCKLYTYHYISNDRPVLYGFSDELEKEIFIHLVSVSGIGPNTARMILSGHRPNDIALAIAEGNLALLKGIKGVGPKSAQRLILELKEKMQKSVKKGPESQKLGNTKEEEALSALIMLGFNRAKAQKAVNQAITSNPNVGDLEGLVKEALKII